MAGLLIRMDASGNLAQLSQPLSVVPGHEADCMPYTYIMLLAATLSYTLCYLRIPHCTCQQQ
jgi:hypothetical protein